MQIHRNRYLNQLIQRRHNGLIKVVTGVKGCGRSYLVFTLFQNYLRFSGVSDDHIITMAMDVPENRPYRDPDVLLAYLKGAVRDDEEFYILLDEFQMVCDFESVLNSLLHIPNADVYVTGSHSRFLTSDIITEFRGRGDDIRLHPLTFSEYMSAYEGDRYLALQEYYYYGGLSQILSLQSEEQMRSYLKDLCARTIVPDLIGRSSITRPKELDALMELLASDIGTLTSTAQITNALHSRILQPTVWSYIDDLMDAYLICEAKRYDVRGRKYLFSPEKYSFEDLGLRNAVLGFRQTDPARIQTNVIFNELPEILHPVCIPSLSSRRGTADKSFPAGCHGCIPENHHHG